MDYFKGLETVEEVKAAYRKMALQLHPDKNQDADANERMSELNSQFDEAILHAKRVSVKDNLSKSQFSEAQKEAADFKQTFYTQYGWAGSRVHEGKSLKEVSKIVKSYVKDVYPTWKFSVRTSYFSGGCELAVTILEVPYDIFSNAGIKAYADDKARGSCGDYQEAVQENIKYWNRVREEHQSVQNIDQDGMPFNESATAVIKDVSNLINSYRTEDIDGQIDYFDVNFWYHFYLGNSYRDGWKIVPKTARITSSSVQKKAKKICA